MSKKNKAILGVASGTLTAAATALANQRYYAGGFLTAFSIGLFIAYDHYGDVQLPSGVDEETFNELAELGADGIKQLRDELESRQ